MGWLRKAGSWRAVAITPPSILIQVDIIIVIITVAWACAITWHKFDQLLGQQSLVAPLTPPRFGIRAAPALSLVGHDLFQICGNSDA